MAFYTFTQNNSGGRFTGDYYVVIVEARTPAVANAIATDECGIYFDGVAKGMDCGCCGDRWSDAWGDGDETPNLYGEPVETLTYDRMWCLKALVVYADGTRKEYPSVVEGAS